MDYHPKDTTEVYRRNPDSVDQLWYKVHYFQLSSHLPKNNKNPLSQELKLSKESHGYIANLLNQRKSNLFSQGKHCQIAGFRGTLDGKLVHGLGGAHVRETSMTLHPLYGIPYIPASSLKGALRHWIIQALFGGIEDELKNGLALEGNKAELRALYLDLFGSEDQAGLLRFYDAFADPGFTLVPDILTVHFPEYYRQSSPPADNGDPTPVDLLVVGRAEMEFIVSIRKSSQPTASGLTREQLLELGVLWLQKMLQETGIGSKTSAGYGYFKDFRPVPIPVKQVSPTPARPAPINPVVQEKPPEGLSYTELLVWEIERLGSGGSDSSKSEIFNSIVGLDPELARQPAQALKEYWQTTGDWTGGSKKQKAKVDKIKAILGE